MKLIRMDMKVKDIMERKKESKWSKETTKKKEIFIKKGHEYEKYQLQKKSKELKRRKNERKGSKEEKREGKQN